MDQLKMFLSGGAVRRFHTIPTIQLDTVGSHSHLVSCLVTMLGLPDNVELKLLKAALFHDLAEQEIGDIPSPLKRSAPEVATRIRDFEEAFNRYHGIHIELTMIEKSLLNFCDNIAGALFCISEYRCGNAPMLSIAKRFLEYSEEIVNRNFSEETNSVLELYKEVLKFLEATVVNLVEGR